MIVAEIAKRQLTPDVAATIDDYVTWMASIGPFPQNPDMVQAACWPDDIKTNNRAMSNWHFNNGVYNPQNIPVDQCAMQDMNVVSVADMLDRTLLSGNASKWVTAFSLVTYIHLIGDIHQPLHTVEMFSPDFPDGDAGGNKFSVTFKGSPTNLHGVWDSVCGQYPNDPDRPLSQDAMQQLKDSATSLIGRYNISDNNAQIFNTTMEYEESYALAVSTSYAGITPNSIISSTYTTTCISTAERQLVLAGYRLGNRLNTIFGRSSSQQHFRGKE